MYAMKDGSNLTYRRKCVLLSHHVLTLTIYARKHGLVAMDSDLIAGIQCQPDVCMQPDK